MGKRKFNPLPQTTRELPGTRFSVMSRTSSFAAPATRPVDAGWNPVWLPEPKQVWPPVMALNLTKLEAEQVLAYWQSRPEQGRFEYKLVMC